MSFRVACAVAAGVVIGFSSAHAADKRIIYNLTSPTPTVGEAPHSSVPAILGYWKEAGLDVEVNPTSGSTQAVQLVAAGTSNFTMATVEPLIIGKQKGGKLIAVYNHVREPIYTIAVQTDSPIKRLEDLGGKRIGVLSLSSGAVPFSKAMLSSAGVEPEKGVTWLPTGIGQQSVHAIKTGQVDALAYWDWAYAIMENAGVTLRHFTTPATKDVLSLMIVGNEEFVSANPDVTAKFAQAIAKAALFTITNPEAAVRIHWEKYPQSKPSGLSDEQALKDATHVLKARLEKYRIDNREVRRWGASTAQEWNATQDFLINSKLITEKRDVSIYYTEKFLDQVNSFDQKAVVDRARAYK